MAVVVGCVLYGLADGAVIYGVGIEFGTAWAVIALCVGALGGFAFGALLLPRFTR